MEFEGNGGQQLGRRCTLCRKLDYLPVKCALCADLFCDEHQAPDAHACVARKLPVAPADECPQCGLVLRGTPLDAHLKVCVARRFRVDPRCAFAPCGRRDPLAVTCPLCNATYCVAHRLPEDHACAALAGGAPAPAQAPLRKLKLKLPKPTLRYANAREAPLGDARVEGDERLYCAVHFALAGAAPLPPRHMFFSWRWSAGRILDDVAQRVPSLPRPRPPARHALYAVRRAGGVNLLPHVTPLRDLPAGTVAPGDALVVADTADGLPHEWVAAITPKVASRAWKRRAKVPAGAAAAAAEPPDKSCVLA